MASHPIYVLAPSFFSLAISGFLILAYIFVLGTHFSSFLKFDYVKQLQIIGTLCIAFAVHGSLHLGLENTYNFNPYSLLMR